MIDNTACKFFLGTNSETGFVSKFNELYNPLDNLMAYIVKGGPGTGKSTMMKKVFEKCFELDKDVELIYCATDPDSLDAVIFPKLKICIADGTSPHVLEPEYTGASSTIVNLCDCFNTQNLVEAKADIIRISEENSKYHKFSQRYLSLCGRLMENVSHEVSECINFNKITSYCERLVKKRFSQMSNEKKENTRFISGITPKGIVTFTETIKTLCDSDNIYVFEDEYNTVGNIILTNFRNLLLSLGVPIITCPHPLKPLDYIQCIIVPDFKTCFLVDYKSNLDLGGNINKINTKRFLSNESIRKIRNKLRFQIKIQTELLNEAISNLKQAKRAHDNLELLYRDSVNYNKVDKLKDNIIQDIFLLCNAQTKENT